VKTELFTVSRIFTESIYRIPDYQRGYSWGEDQLRDFWLDIEQLPADGKHYTGVLTLEEVPEVKWVHWLDDAWIIQARRYKPYYIVDGQQRLTTVVILIQVILEKINSRTGYLNYTPVNDVRKKYIFDSKLEDRARSYIFGYEKDNPSYEFLKTKIFLEQSDVHMPDEDTVYTKNLLSAKQFFAQMLDGMQDEDLQKLFTKVTQQLVFNVYEITSDIDVFVTFETMNNRGKPLSTLELLKNRLIFLSTKVSVPSGREGVLRRAINDAWKSAYHYLGKNDERPLDDDDFLRTQLSYFYIAELKEIPKPDEEGRETALRMYRSAMEGFGRFLLNVLFTPKRIGNGSVELEEGAYGFASDALPGLSHQFIYDFSQHIKHSVELYFNLSNAKTSNFQNPEKVWLERIGRLNNFKPSSILLALYTKEKKYEKRLRVLEALERHLFLQSLRLPYAYGHSRFAVNEVMVKYVAGELSTDELVTIYDNFVTDSLKENALGELLADWVKNGNGYYSWDSIKYFLYEYELDLQSRSKTQREKISWNQFLREDFKGDYQTVEHIYPQRARDGYWRSRFTDFNTTQRRLLRNSLGNLLALSRPKNASLGNRPFPEKRDGEKGYRFGSYSENEVAMLAEWGPEQIEHRGLHLLGFFERRWKLQIGDEAAKLNALGLGFLRGKRVGVIRF